MTETDRDAFARLRDERSPGSPPLDPASIPLRDEPRAGSHVLATSDHGSDTSGPPPR
jgi:hypothetical protein